MRHEGAERVEPPRIETGSLASHQGMYVKLLDCDARVLLDDGQNADGLGLDDTVHGSATFSIPPQHVRPLLDVANEQSDRGDVPQASAAPEPQLDLHARSGAQQTISDATTSSSIGSASIGGGQAKLSNRESRRRDKAERKSTRQENRAKRKASDGADGSTDRRLRGLRREVEANSSAVSSSNVDFAGDTLRAHATGFAAVPFDRNGARETYKGPLETRSIDYWLKEQRYVLVEQPVSTAGHPCVLHSLLSHARRSAVFICDQNNVQLAVVCSVPASWATDGVMDEFNGIISSTLESLRRAKGSAMKVGRSSEECAGLRRSVSARNNNEPQVNREAVFERKLIDRLLEQPVMRRVLGHIDRAFDGRNHTHAAGSFETCVPGVYQFYTEVKARLHAVEKLAPGLVSRTVAKYPFTALWLNLGPRTVSIVHRDSENEAYGQCVALPFGKFDHRRGGHLLLHELRVAIELAPGGACFFPSSLITHSNAALADDDETRGSVIGYTSGTLTRSHHLDGALVKNMSKEEQTAYKDGSAARKAEKIARFPVR